MLRLVGTDGVKTYAWDIKPGKYLIGRMVAADFYIANKSVSRQHAELEVTPDLEVFLSDLGSHNGTLVNSVPLESRQQIQVGDRLVFGEAEFKLSDQDTPSSLWSRPATTKLAQIEPEKSVFISINEALQPLPSKVAEIPDVLPTLFEMARTLVASEAREAMLERSLGLIARVIPAERLAILTSPGTGDEVQIEACHLPDGKDPGSLRLSRTIINDILTNKNAILIGDAAEDPHFAAQDSIVRSELKSAMAVPLFEEGEVLGILYVDTSNPVHRYNNGYLKLLATFGNIIASRLVNYTLLDERAEKQLIEAELKRASSIQKKLLDIKRPSISGYEVRAFQEPCLAVGGDMYDFCILPDGRLIFMVADVSGKGMGAALLMSNILASFRIMYHDPQLSLIKLVETVSTQLFTYSAPEDFATLFVGLLDADRNLLKFISAGHNPAFLVRSDGSTEELAASGVMIGAFGGAQWQEAEKTFYEGDLLCVYSDGVTEAESSNDQYGELRLEKMLIDNRRLTPEEIGENLLTSIDNFVGDSPQSDDITVLLVKRTKAADAG